MKKFCAFFAIFSLFVFVSCGGSKNENKNDETDTGETVTDEDSADTEPADDTEPTETTPDTDDSADSDDKTDSDDSQEDTDSTDSGNDSDDPIEDNDETDSSDSQDDADSTDSGNDSGDSQPDDDADTETEPTEAEKCDTAGGTWNATEEKCTKTTNCTGNPEHTEWNGASSYTQTYTDGAWSAETAAEYNTTEGVCHYKCVEKYGWIGSQCLIECSANSTFPCYDPESKLIWSGKSTNSMQWIYIDGSGNEVYPAKSYCEELNTSNYGGFSSGWRLPTISELRTLIQNCSTTELSSPDAEPNGGDFCYVRDDNFAICLSHSVCWTDSCEICEYGEHSKLGDTQSLWSSSRPSDVNDGMWRVYFSYAMVDIKDFDGTAYVRCVR